MSVSENVIAWIESSLTIPTGPRAGEPVQLADFQKEWIAGSLEPDIRISCLSVARGQGKTSLAAMLAVAGLLGVMGQDRAREIICVARVRSQAKILWDYCRLFVEKLPDEWQARIRIRRMPALEIELDGEHTIRAIAADSKSTLGLSPWPFVLCDERAYWREGSGEELEDALLSSLGKRGGRCLMISTSGDSDANAFSQWLDRDDPGVYRQEHRADPDLPADDIPSLMQANPGSAEGIGTSVEWLMAEAKRAVARGGHTLASFRLYNRNERAKILNDTILSPDEWLACETAELPERGGKLVIGLDLGSSSSMTAAAFYWESGRLEVRGWWPANPCLATRGINDGVGRRYVEMHDHAELAILGDKTVPIQPWLHEVETLSQGYPIEAVVADRFKQAEVGEAMDAAGWRHEVVWRGMGWWSAGEDCNRFRREVYDHKVRTAPTLLMRHAIADACVMTDPAGSQKLAKGKSTGKIDALAATILAVAESSRRQNAPSAPGRIFIGGKTIG